MTETNDNNTLDFSEVKVQLAELLAMVESMDQRLSALEEPRAKPQVPKEPSSVVPDGLTDDQIKRWLEVSASREKLKDSKYVNTSKKQVAASELQTRLGEIEGQTLTSAVTRLNNWRTKGTITSYRTIPPGGQYPQDTDPKRVLIRVDSNNIITSAELG